MTIGNLMNWYRDKMMMRLGTMTIIIEKMITRQQQVIFFGLRQN